MRVTLKAGADLTAHIFPEKSAWLEEQFEHLSAAGMVSPNPHSVYANVTMAVPKGLTFRLVVHGCGANLQCELAPAPMVALDQEFVNFAGAKACFKLSMLQGYWQCALDEASQELLTFVTRKRLFHSHAGAPGSAEHHFVLAGDDAEDCQYAGREYLPYARR